MNTRRQAVRVIDSHTGGEPTRTVTEGGPKLGGGTLAQRALRLEREAHDFRRMLIGEPRGYEAMVGAVICEPTDPACVAGVIFFNNRGYLGMCGHGTIGVAVTLAHLDRIEPGPHKLETPVGVVAFELLDANQVAIENVPCYRLHANVCIEVDDLGTITGDVAWGGNWFFLAHSTPMPLVAENAGPLTAAALRVRRELNRRGIRGDDGAEIDHIEFFGPAESRHAHSRNFVLCSGGAYDRSPCGTGTSAKLACLAADRKLAPGETWIQESIIGSRFVTSYREEADGRIVPTIKGNAYVIGESQLFVHPEDPFRCGIPVGGVA